MIDGCTVRIEAAKQKLSPLRCSRILSALLVLALSLSWEQPAAAQLSLIWVRNVAAGAGGSYRFSENSSSGSGHTLSSSKQGFTEDCSLSADLSLFNPLFIDGSAEVDLQMNQMHETTREGRSESTSDWNINYLVSGQLFKDSPTPVSVGAGSQLSVQTPAFSRSYDLKSDEVNFGFSVRNRMLPTEFSFLKTSSLTSGLEQDRRQSTHVATIRSEHTYGTFSRTRLNLLLSNSENQVLEGGPATRLREGNVSLGNNLNWQSNSGLSRDLIFNYEFDESAGTYPGRSQKVVSTLRAALGKALDSEAHYSFISSNTSAQELRLHTGGFTVSHRLYESLITTLSANGSKSEYNDGTETDYGSGAGFAYRFKSPSQKLYTLLYNASFSVADRLRKDPTVSVVNERYDIPAPVPRRITLAHPTFIAGTVIVRGAAQTYELNTDYVLTTEGIEVLPGRMVLDTYVLISYSYLQDPEVAFGSLRQSLAGRVTLPESQSSVYFDFNTTDPWLISGTATAVTLSPTRHLDLGYDRSLGRHTFHAEYGWNETFSSDLHYLDGRWTYQKPWAEGDLSIGANDHFGVNVQGNDKGGIWDNAFNLQGTYTRQFSDAIKGRGGIGYFNSLSGAGLSNLLSANCNLDARFGRTTITLTSAFSFSVSSGSTGRSESLALNLRRFF